MKYKIGDKVAVRKDLEIDEKYGGLTWHRSMDFLAGKILTVENVNSATYDFAETYFRLSDKMIEDIEQPFEFQNFDFVEYRNGEVGIVNKEKGLTILNTDGFATLALNNINSNYDVMKVYRPSYCGQYSFNSYKQGSLVYERKGVDRQKWIDDMFEKAMADKSIVFLYYEDKTIVHDKNGTKCAMSTPKNTDVYSRKIGVAVAYAKYKGYEIPKEI